jgi:hypothetical protein
MTKLFVAGVMLISSQAFAQTPDSRSTPSAQPNDTAAINGSLATPTGHEVNVSVANYDYVEPGAPSISIHGPKIGGGYTGTLSLDKRQHWFAQTDVRGTIGKVTYDGACSPFLIVPNGTSPNGYELDVGDYSPCSETGDNDWYAEARVLVGKDFIGQKWALSPLSGLGFRHLSNGTTGIAGYRTDNYLYLPFGITTRTKLASQSALSFNVEYDLLLHGWQKTRDSALGGGDVPATPVAPAFTVDGFTDISFAQHAGWALRASAKFQVNPRWSLEPYYLHWSVSASPVNYETAAFTVNKVTAHEQFGAFEPFNTTNELGVRLAFPF